MIEITLSSFIDTLYKALTSSPSAVITLIIGIIFLISMIVNIKKNKKIGKHLFIVGWLFIVIFIMFKYNNYLTNLFDNFVNNIFMQIFFPDFSSYIIIIIISNFIFLITFLRKKVHTSDKITNSLFFTVIMILFLITLDKISKSDVNVYEKLTVYSNETLLILIESTTITFIIWIVVIISKFIIKKLIKKSDDNVKEKFIKPANDDIEVLEL